MEQWHGFGITFNSDQAIRNYFKESSLPHFMSDSVKEGLGLTKVVDIKPTITATQYVVEGDIVEILGVPTRQYTVVEYTVEELSAMQATAMAQVVQHFTDTTTAYIEGKVQEYNVANGLAFKDIDAFTKYAVTPASMHNTIANQFISYADKVWTAVRTYQATATAIPTDEEFKVVLDSVVF